MEQEVEHSQGGCNLRCDLKVSGEMIMMVHIFIEYDSLVLRLRMLSGAPEWMDLLSAVQEWMYT
jgi:hypothetical protein